MKKLWDNLNLRQKYYLIAGVIFVCGAIFIQFVVFPFFDAKERVNRSLAANEKTLAELKTLGVEYGILKQKSMEIQRVLAGRPADFALFSYLERKAGEVGVKGNIKFMNPVKGKTVGPYEETAVDMQLEKITLRQVTNFLYVVESPNELIKIKRISIQKMKDSPEYLSAFIQVITYQPLKAGGGL
ncbi:MAG: type II secretion system protein M [Deltaproteobacteria bacterium]|nr:type II secretion system protein M [Deltaproteobacteria bacterium]